MMMITIDVYTFMVAYLFDNQCRQLDHFCLLSSFKMASLEGDSLPDCHDIQQVEGPIENLSASNIQDIFNKLSLEAKVKIRMLHDKGDPVKILVVGLTGSGKSTLINNLVGENVAMVGHGVDSVTSRLGVYEVDFCGIKIQVYDTTGFGDSKGKSHQDILKEIAHVGKFDLMLLCIKTDGRFAANEMSMFTLLRNEIAEEMWMRSIVVLTFTDVFFLLGSSPNSDDLEKKIHSFRNKMSRILSVTMCNETIANIPFCTAEKHISPNNPWLENLWEVCVNRCNSDVRPLMGLFSKYRIIEVGSIVVAGIILFLPLYKQLISSSRS